MNITLKLKTSPRPSNLPVTSYVPFSSLPPPTLFVTPRDSEINWMKDSMTQGLPWFKHLSGFMGRLTVLLNNSFCRMDVNFYSGRVIRYYASIVASILIGIYQGGRSREI
ncbi:hypothetical protein RclHR1_18940004 [Rhizophagus clarus]|uniref:Uncharacterized protein n=1 Tax=Rhizophagus clarus TaxID=94130 RepID=A0A2Z6RGI8_9GLOM|nr:hypothetical protein RclHR1_18940004 [Rhizophagus clarus]GES82667.1 hypothetical protein GLOIN_2v1785553 [Rhizophagus clarus]